MPISEGFRGRLLGQLPNLLDQVPTPFYVYDSVGIRETYRSLLAAFSGHPYTQHFAVKALPNPAILQLLTEDGSGLDCASAPELRLAQELGVGGSRVVYTGNNSTRQEIRAAVSMGAVVTFDDISALGLSDPLPEVVAFRVAPSSSESGSTLMGSGENAKFGVPEKDLADAYRQAWQRGARRFGIHGMTRANELNVSTMVAAGRDLLRLAGKVEADSPARIEYVNFGGGLGVPYMPADAPFDITAYGRELIRAVESSFPERTIGIRTEIGRYITASHGVLVTKVINRMRKAHDLIGVDASMSALMRPALYGAYHHISILDRNCRPAQGDTVPMDVVGSLCENMDKFAVGRLLPNAVRPGYLALIQDVGAHGHSMGFNYNGRLRPAEILITGARSAELIRTAETYEDYTRTLVRRQLADISEEITA